MDACASDEAKVGGSGEVSWEVNLDNRVRGHLLREGEAKGVGHQEVVSCCA